MWNVVEGNGGLGVLVRVPGLVKPPSLVSSVVDVVLLLLQVEAQESPLDNVLDSVRSSVGELALEDCNALVKSDSLR